MFIVSFWLKLMDTFRVFLYKIVKIINGNENAQKFRLQTGFERVSDNWGGKESRFCGWMEVKPGFRDSLPLSWD
jgi:hypothetical protein